MIITTSVAKISRSTTEILIFPEMCLIKLYKSAVKSRIPRRQTNNKQAHAV